METVEQWLDKRILFYLEKFNEEEKQTILSFLEGMAKGVVLNDNHRTAIIG